MDRNEEKIQAFVEFTCDCRSDCKRSGVVRAGPNTRRYLDPYTKACPFKVRDIEPFGPTAVLIGFSNKDDDKGLSLRSYLKAAIRVLTSYGLCTQWDRVVGEEVQTYTMDRKGKLHMAKEKIAPVSDIFDGGKFNKGKFMSSLAHAMKQIDAGHYEITNGSTSESPISGGVRITISFDRMEK